MSTSSTRLLELYDRFISDTATESELKEFWRLVKDMPDDHPLHDKVYRLYESIEANTNTSIDWSRARERIFALDAPDTVTEETQSADNPPDRRIHFLKTGWFKYAAAILILIGVGTYVFISNQKEEPSVTQTNPVPVQNDVAPGGNKAVLTLADGTKIILDSAANGILAEQGETSITKRDGQIVYEQSTSPVSLLPSPVFNTMSTPRGGQYQLTLPDGSQVWLNAESSITYPTAFGGKTREVTVTGEAYFEITKNKAKPFIVICHPEPSSAKRNEREGPAEKPILQIEVLGTHFNVNTYKEESTKNITLLEGSVRLRTSSLSRLPSPSVHTSLILKPGQQGQLTSNRQLSLAATPDVDQVMAWKNGLFNFNYADLQTVMRQLARWYDVKVSYEANVPQMQFYGKMERNLTLRQVLNILEKSGVHFNIRDRELIVRSR